MNVRAASDWPALCAAHGLRMNAPRRAILTALVESDRADDAVTPLQATCRHHPATRIGTVYRFLRELERAGLARVEATPSRRRRWQLCGPAPPDDGRAAEPSQMREFLRELDRLDPGGTLPTSRAEAHRALLAKIAARLGYRLSPDPTLSHQGTS